MTSREHPTATITTPNSTPGQSGRFGSESVAAFVGMRSLGSKADQHHRGTEVHCGRKAVEPIGPGMITAGTLQRVGAPQIRSAMAPASDNQVGSSTSTGAGQPLPHRQRLRRLPNGVDQGFRRWRGSGAFSTRSCCSRIRLDIFARSAPRYFPSFAAYSSDRPPAASGTSFSSISVIAAVAILVVSRSRRNFLPVISSAISIDSIIHRASRYLSAPPKLVCCSSAA